LASDELCLIVATGLLGMGCNNNSNNNFSSLRLIWAIFLNGFFALLSEN